MAPCNARPCTSSTGSWWETAPSRRRPSSGAPPRRWCAATCGLEDIQTEVFFFPSAAHTEKEGSYTNTQRLVPWRHKAVEPIGESRSDLHFVHDLGVRLKKLYADST